MKEEVVERDGLRGYGGKVDTRLEEVRIEVPRKALVLVLVPQCSNYCEKAL